MRQCVCLRIIIAIGLSCIALNSVRAQSDFSERNATAGLSAGLGFAGGASMSIEAPELWKVTPVFAWRGTVDTYYPLTPVIAATLSFGIDHRGAKLYWYQDKTMWEMRQVDYFSVAPGFLFGAFYLGVNFGFPMGGARHWQTFSDLPENSTELDNTVNELSTMIEPRIGAVVPVMDEDIGWLGVTFAGGYNLSNMSESSEFFPGAFLKQNVGSQTVSLHLGVTWQFAIPGTSKKPVD